MLRLLSAADLLFLEQRGYSAVRHFRRERAAIYFGYFFELCRDLRALPLWAPSNDPEAFREMDEASWTTQKMLVQLAWEGVLYSIGIRQRGSGEVERCFQKLGIVLSDAA